MASAPQRRCTGCGRIAGKAQLVRLAVVDERRAARPPAVVIDARQRLQGRGAYLCANATGVPVRECLETALRRGGIARTLRCGTKIDSAGLLEALPAEDLRPRRLKSVGR